VVFYEKLQNWLKKIKKSSTFLFLCVKWGGGGSQNMGNFAKVSKPQY